MLKTRLIMVGGFLGAGKTTTLDQVARRLTERGSRVGLITNDQSQGLVDTAFLSQANLPVEEVTGGCFCCKFTSLVDAAQKLTMESTPDVFLAEPVGSCTDLTATISYPLRTIYGEDYEIAPLSVLVDAVRARRVLGLEPGKNFSEKVQYIYGKQLEEAEIIVINKCDLLDESQLQELETAMQQQYPQAEVVRMTARSGEGVDAWLTLIENRAAQLGKTMEVDYDVYAEGEAKLGWLNLAANVSSETEFDGNALLNEIAAGLQQRLQDQEIEIAHLKMTFAPRIGNDLGVVNVVRNDLPPQQSHSLQELCTAGELLINLRAEGHPEALQAAVSELLQSLDPSTIIAKTHLECFMPSPPVPTHRHLQG